MKPSSLAIPLVLLASLLTSNAEAAPKLTKNQCIDAAEEGQSLRDKGKMSEARTRFVTCASAECPGVVAKECASWLNDMEARIPTVVLGAVDATGADLVDVKVTLDGKPFADKLGGTQQPIDPGPHKLRFEYKNANPVEENVVVQERQKGRAIQAKFADVNAPAAAAAPPIPGKPPEDEANKPGPPIAAYVLGGVGIVSLGVGAYFGITGYSEFNDLKDRNCSPNCPKDETDAISQKFLISDITLGVGVVAVGVAAYLLLSRPKGPTQVNIGGLSVSPVREGWMAGYQRRF
jgi:hypothetical protein